MSMSYCQFENTIQDLVDCLDSLREVGSVEEYEKNCSEYELPYIRKLIDVCKDITDEFGYCLE